MRIQKVHLLQFKRFDDLTIDLGAAPAKIVAMLGPNGCGKSSVFDAFERRMKAYRNKGNPSNDFYSKAKYSSDPKVQALAANLDNAVTITPDTNSEKAIYIRSSYRYTSQLNVTRIEAQPGIFQSEDYPNTSIELDTRLATNYTRLLASSYSEFEGGKLTEPGPTGSACYMLARRQTDPRGGMSRIANMSVRKSGF